MAIADDADDRMHLLAHRRGTDVPAEQRPVCEIPGSGRGSSTAVDSVISWDDSYLTAVDLRTDGPGGSGSSAAAPDANRLGAGHPGAGRTAHAGVFDGLAAVHDVNCPAGHRLPVTGPSPSRVNADGDQAGRVLLRRYLSVSV
ncbi:hypothetical protein ABZ079_21790 [Streptomyces sp. NPDC006314]|uniref:hypothetical protein n=1 Tax=Streptomyces sp. NPDC006314 TaxID=3154475 RepID=UPI0033AA49F0